MSLNTTPLRYDDLQDPAVRATLRAVEEYPVDYHGGWTLDNFCFRLRYWSPFIPLYSRYSVQGVFRESDRYIYLYTVTGKWQEGPKDPYAHHVISYDKILHYYEFMQGRYSTFRELVQTFQHLSPYLF